MTVVSLNLEALHLEILSDRNALADRAAEVLATALRAPGPRSLIVTGGGTPGPTYDRLATWDLDWAATTVTLTDERWVEPVSDLSNEGLVRRRLLVGQAALATFLPLKGDGASPQADALAAEAALRKLSPVAALVGMGDDGHIASLFPSAPGLDAALDPQGERLCVGVAQAGLDPRVPRISLTLRALLLAARVVILVTGEPKRALLERVAADPAYHPPVAAILRQSLTPVLVLWAP
jgi:6-phosphogluconolactonase